MNASIPSYCRNLCLITHGILCETYMEKIPWYWIALEFYQFYLTIGISLICNLSTGIKTLGFIAKTKLWKRKMR